MKRTPWFPITSPPIREGWYEVRLPFFQSLWKLRWDGKWDMSPIPTFFYIDDVMREFRWRGIHG